MGGIVVATGVLAGLAGGYAIYTIFEPKGDLWKNQIHGPTVLIAILFGIIWGLIIFNIDRFIVTSTGKGDGTEAITKQEFRSSIPRIIMGMIIALTISKPIEIRMFQSEIDYELNIKKEKIKQQDEKKIRNLYSSQLTENENEIKRLQSEIADAHKEFVVYDNEAVLEWEGKSGTGQSGDGPAYRMKRARANEFKQRWDTQEKLNTEKIQDLKLKNTEVKGEMKTRLANINEQTDMLNGLLERIKLAHKVAGTWISLFITLLFMVIELTPIFFKMMLIKSPYDYMDENVKELARAEAGIEIEYNFYKDGNGVEKHKVINHAAELIQKEKLALYKAQNELNQQIISEWQKAKSADIRDNPEKYTSEN